MSQTVRSPCGRYYRSKRGSCTGNFIQVRPSQSSLGYRVHHSLVRFHAHFVESDHTKDEYTVSLIVLEVLTDNSVAAVAERFFGIKDHSVHKFFVHDQSAMIFQINVAIVSIERVGNLGVRMDYMLVVFGHYGHFLCSLINYTFTFLRVSLILIVNKIEDIKHFVDQGASFVHSSGPGQQSLSFQLVLNFEFLCSMSQVYDIAHCFPKVDATTHI